MLLLFQSSASQAQATLRLFGKVDGSVDRHDRAEWLTPVFNLAFYSTVPTTIVAPDGHSYTVPYKSHYYLLPYTDRYYVPPYKERTYEVPE